MRVIAPLHICPQSPLARSGPFSLQTKSRRGFCCQQPDTTFLWGDSKFSVPPAERDRRVGGAALTYQTFTFLHFHVTSKLKKIDKNSEDFFFKE